MRFIACANNGPTESTVINGRIFREGEVDPSAGFEVEKIGPDEVVVKTPWGERRTLKLGEVMGR